LWAKLSTDDMELIAGRQERLAGRIQDGMESQRTLLKNRLTNGGGEFKGLTRSRREKPRRRRCKAPSHETIEPSSVDQRNSSRSPDGSQAQNYLPILVLNARELSLGTEL
jgi:hypothetical protein